MATKKKVAGDGDTVTLLAEESGKSEESNGAPGSLSENQVRERLCKKTKERIFWLLFVSALVDTMGASLLSPAYAMAVSNAPGAVPPTDGVHPDAFPTIPVTFSLAVNCISSALVLGGVFSSLTMGPLSDKLGRKPLIIIGLVGGALGYLCMYFAAAVMRSYVAFVGAMFVNGLFSSTKSVMMSYFADVYTPEEFGQKQPIFGMAMLTGGAAGGIFGGIIIAATGSLWVASLFGFVASLFFSACIWLVMPAADKPKSTVNAKKSDAAQPDGPAEADKGGLATGVVKKVLLICIVAGSLDALGDEGNRFARSTIMPQSYPLTKAPSVMSLVGSSNVLATMFCMFLVMGRQKKDGLAFYTVFGNAASAVVQFTLLFIIGLGDGGWQLGLYVLIWWLGQFFGFTSSMAKYILVGQKAPKQERGYWNGLSGAAENLAKFIGPLVLSVLYGEENRAQLVLGVMGTISLLATLAYLPLPRLLPRPAPAVVTLQPMDKYERMRHVEFMALPLAERWMLAEERTKLGKPQINHGWGAYEEQVPQLRGLIERSADDFAFLKDTIITTVSDRAKMDAFRAYFAAFRERLANDPAHAQEHAAAQEDMGRWLGAYFDDAGYQGWMFYPELFKAMVMTAFPPIEALDSKAGSSFHSLKAFEQQQIHFMSVMDAHLSTAASKDSAMAAYLQVSNGPPKA